MRRNGKTITQMKSALAAMEAGEWPGPLTPTFNEIERRLVDIERLTDSGWITRTQADAARVALRTELGRGQLKIAGA